MAVFLFYAAIAGTNFKFYSSSYLIARSAYKTALVRARWCGVAALTSGRGAMLS